MTVNVNDEMTAVFARAGGVPNSTKRAALCVQSVIDDFAIKAGVLNSGEVSRLAAAVALRLQMERRLDKSAE